MKDRPELFDLFIGRRGVDTICKKDYPKVLLKIDPNGTPGVAKVTYGALRKMAACLRIYVRGTIPCKQPK